MPCLLTGLAFFFPRLVIVLLFLFSDWLGRAYGGTAIIWPILGFIFMPYTMLAYGASVVHGGGVSGLWLVLVVVAVLVDLGVIGGGARTTHTRTVVVRRN